MLVSRRALVAAGTAVLAVRALPARAAAFGDPLAPPAMQADLDLLLRAYETVHPGLYRYLPPGGFAARVAAAKVWAREPRTLADFYLALARLSASVRCGHSHPNPYNQGRAARAALFAGRDRVPFAFRWIGGRMIVTGGRRGQTPLPPGSEIVELDRQAPRRLLAAMMPLARADGGNDAKRVALLGVAGRDRFAPFDVFRPMLFPRAGEGTIELIARLPTNATRRLVLPAWTEDDLVVREPDGGALDWTFDISSEGIGLLTMRDWVTYRTQWDWRAFIDEAVDRLIEERARGLIVDIRGNEGGTECGWHLLERIVARKTPLPPFVAKVRYRRLPDDLAPALDTWDPAFRDWGAQAAGPDSEGFFRLIRPASDRETIEPRGRRFAGAVAVLVDAACSSATFQFAHAVQAHRLATLVGETTGGNRRGINGSAYFFVRLPQSGLEVDLPIVGEFPAAPQPDAGIVPDHLVAVSAQDIARGFDRQMQTALGLIKETAPA